MTLTRLSTDEEIANYEAAESPNDLPKKGLERDDTQSLNVSRLQVYGAIDTEIDYARLFVAPERKYYVTHTIGEFILMLNQYVAQAQQKWTHHSDGIDGFPESLHEVRKIAAIAARCMIEHGAPQRIFPTKSAGE